MSTTMKALLQSMVAKQQGYLELRWHKRISNQFLATKGRVDTANHGMVEGIGVRALVDGSWGFAATADTRNPRKIKRQKHTRNEVNKPSFVKNI